MKSIPDINSQICRLNTAIAALNAMNSTVQSVMIIGDRPVIRIARNNHCLRMIKEGKASYNHTGRGSAGVFRQGVFFLHGCRVCWSESLIN